MSLRKKKIKLDFAGKEWKDAYLIAWVRGVKHQSNQLIKIAEIQTEMKRLGRRLERVDIKIDKLMEKEKVEDVSDEEFEKLEKEQDKYNEKVTQMTNDMFDYSKALLKQDIIEGKVYDYKASSLRDFKESDIAEMDTEMVNNIMEVITGDLGKKE
jgi:hypothetical protein